MIPEAAWADRFLGPDPGRRRVARQLYEGIESLPIVSPHGHVDPRVLADPNATFGDPAQLFVIPDHYILRMLYSQGIPMEALRAEADHRRVWQLFADNVALFRATPSGIWLASALRDTFGIDEPLSGTNAMAVYDELSAKLATPEYSPRRLFERARIETLCTTDDAADPLDAHRAIRESGWAGDVRPTFRPDLVVNLLTPGWRGRLEALSNSVGREIATTSALVAALEERRARFRGMGAVATDHGVESAYTGTLTPFEADAILSRALRGAVSSDDAELFRGHMLVEMARMSVDDGLVMQLHVGSLRDHNLPLHERFGSDIGADIPVAVEFTRNLRPLLNRFGNDPRFRLILFTLDGTAYARELAPLAGHYPAVLLGPPWWFDDSLNGIARYFDQVIETAGLRNTAGFNDDTRAFCSIPVRHDVWRRATSDWLAGLVVRGIVSEDDAAAMAHEMAYDLAKHAYRLDQAPGRDGLS
jgi:glucuronate isomerase